MIPDGSALRAADEAASEAADEAADELARFSRQLYERGWMPGTSGNLSVLVPGGAAHHGAADGDPPRQQALITASGRDKGELTTADAVLVDASTGAAVDGSGPRASAEVSIHAAIYRGTDARAVIHVHSPFATAVACRNGAVGRTATVRLAGYELLKGLGLADPAGTDLPVFPNWPEVPRIAADVAAHLGRTPQAPPGLLIADHGVTAWGRDLAQARNRLECLEAICQLRVLCAFGTDSAASARRGVSRS